LKRHPRDGHTRIRLSAFSMEGQFCTGGTIYPVVDLATAGGEPLDR
jgi:hypothetical protein